MPGRAGTLARATREVLTGQVETGDAEAQEGAGATADDPMERLTSRIAGVSVLIVSELADIDSRPKPKGAPGVR